MNRCTVTDAAQIKCKQHFRPHPPLFITFHAPPDIYLYYHLHTHLPTCFLVLPLHNENIYICMHVCVYTSDYILFIISDHEEKGKSMRNSDYMRVYFPSSVVHLHTHPSYSFSALVSYSNDCNLKYFSLYRMREDWNLKKFMTRCILISATFHNSQISEKVLHLMQNLFPTK